MRTFDIVFCVEHINSRMIENTQSYVYSPQQGFTSKSIFAPSHSPVQNFGFAVQKSKSEELKVLEEILQVMKEIKDSTKLKLSKIEHKGVFCNMCNQQDIQGVRYKCHTCADYDICESCESKNIHPHNFIKINNP